MQKMMKAMKGGGSKKMMRQMEEMQRRGKGGFPRMRVCLSAVSEIGKATKASFCPWSKNLR